MAGNQVYWHYDREEREPSAFFLYCPRDKTRLVFKETGNLSRPTCPKCDFVQFKNPAPAVSVWVIEGDKVLLGKRLNEPGRGGWAPPSGYIEYDTDYLTSAIQEAKEETNLDVEIVSILNVISAFVAPEFHFLTVHMLARVVGGRIEPRDDLEVVDWFPIEGPYPPLAFQEDIDMLAMLRETHPQGLPVSLKIWKPAP